MLVKKHHPGLRRHGNFLLGHTSVVGEEDCLTALAPICLRCEVEEKGPCCLGTDWSLFGLDGYIIGIVICGEEIVSEEKADKDWW